MSKETDDLQINSSKTLLVQMSRLTGERVAYKECMAGSTVTVKDESFLTLANIRPSDPKEMERPGGVCIVPRAAVEAC